MKPRQLKFFGHLVEDDDFEDWSWTVALRDWI